MLFKMRFPAAVLVLFAAIAPAVCLAGGSMHPEHAQHAMVVSVQRLASEAGVAAMKEGGNAIDAAVAGKKRRGSPPRPCTRT